MSVLVINIGSIIYRLAILGLASDQEYITDVEIQVAILFIFILFSILSTRIDVKINAEKINKIKQKEEEQTIIVETMVKIAKTINQDLVEINNNVDDLEESSKIAVNSMREITQGTTETANAAQSQLVMTEKIKGVIDQTEDNFSEIEQNIYKIKDRVGILKNNVNDLNKSNETIINSVETISGISEETMANTEQTQTVSEKNLQIVKLVKALTAELKELSKQLTI